MRDLALARERFANPWMHWRDFKRCEVCHCSLTSGVAWQHVVKLPETYRTVVTCGSHYCRAKGSAS